MSHGTCETVQIKTEPSDNNPTGMVIINALDFVEGEHVLFGTKPVEKKSELKVPKAQPWVKPTE